MKAFVSGQIDERDSIRKVFNQLERLGISVTHDWTRTDDIERPYSSNAKEAGRRALLDVNGVIDANIYIIMTDNMRQGKGMYVELGVALATTHKGTKVFVVGPRNHESIFYYHPLVRHFTDIDKCLRYIRKEIVGPKAGSRKS